jgi:LPS-assembly lipoprotein
MLRAALVALAALGLAACGFRPLYAVTDGEKGRPGLSDIEFTAVRGPKAPRDIMRDTLGRRLPENVDEPRYTAAVDLREQAVAVSVSIDSNARRFNYTLTAAVAYTDRATGERRRQTLQSIASYAVVPSQYASLIAREDAVRRASIDLSRKIEADAVLYAAGQAPQASDDDLFEREGRNDSLRQLEDEAERQREAEEEDAVELIDKDPVP